MNEHHPTTLDIRQFAVWEALTRILNVEPQDPQRPALATVVQPTIDVMQIAAIPTTRDDILAAAAVGTKEIAAVPEDEYWIITRMAVSRESGDRDLNWMALEMPGGGPDLVFSNSNVGGGGNAGALLIPLPIALFLPPDSRINLADSGGATDSIWQLHTLRREIEVRL